MNNLQYGTFYLWSFRDKFLMYLHGRALVSHSSQTDLHAWYLHAHVYTPGAGMHVCVCVVCVYSIKIQMSSIIYLPIYNYILTVYLSNTNS